LCQIVRRRNRGDVDRLHFGADGCERIAGGGKHSADEHLNLIVQHKLLRLRDAKIGFGLVVLKNEFDVHAAQLVTVLFQIHLESVDHVLSDLGKETGHRRDKADTEFFRLCARHKIRAK
jgi:hypothetical protein